MAGSSCVPARCTRHWTGVVAEGLVEADREEVVDGRLRRYYRLTPPGSERLAAEVERLRHNASVAAKRLRLGTQATGGPA